MTFQYKDFVSCLVVRVRACKFMPNIGFIPGDPKEYILSP